MIGTSLEILFANSKNIRLGMTQDAQVSILIEKAIELHLLEGPVSGYSP